MKTCERQQRTGGFVTTNLLIANPRKHNLHSGTLYCITPIPPASLRTLRRELLDVFSARLAEELRSNLDQLEDQRALVRAFQQATTATGKVTVTVAGRNAGGRLEALVA